MNYPKNKIMSRDEFIRSQHGYGEGSKRWKRDPPSPMKPATHSRMNVRAIQALGIVLKQNINAQRASQEKLEAKEVYVNKLSKQVLSLNPSMIILLGAVRRAAFKAAENGEVIAKLQADRLFEQDFLPGEDAFAVRAIDYDHDQFVTILRMSGFHYVHEFNDTSAFHLRGNDGYIRLGWIGWDRGDVVFERFAEGKWLPRLSHMDPVEGARRTIGYYKTDRTIAEYMQISDAVYSFEMCCMFEDFYGIEAR